MTRNLTDSGNGASWTLIPATSADIAEARERCRQLVRRRAIISAGVAVVPIPGVDVVSDLKLFSKLIDDINREFGLTPDQIDQLHPRLKVVAYQAAAGLGGMMVGKLITRQVVLGLLKRGGIKSASRRAARLVPIAGQLASAAIGFTVFRKIGYQHVDACVQVAEELLSVRQHAGPGSAIH